LGGDQLVGALALAVDVTPPAEPEPVVVKTADLDDGLMEKWPDEH
jgi:hypothetical protein